VHGLIEGRRAWLYSSFGQPRQRSCRKARRSSSRAAITDATVGAWVISVLNKNGVPIVPLRAEFGRGKTSAAGRHDAGHEKGKLHNHPPLVSEMARMVDRVDCGSIALFQGSA